jgi:hypothetical protein
VSMLTVADAIGDLTFRGVNNRTLGDTPQAVDERQCPLLARSTHEPDFITDYADQQFTLGGNGRQDYTLNYKYFFAPVGKGRGLFDGEVNSVTHLQTVIAEILRDRRLGGAKYIALASLPSYRTVVDASGKEFHGAVLALRVTEF